ncbi:hypothetical protein Aglo03_13850 [Actinokineospora globicatena]|uniref:Cell division protein FtsZ n=1 Tax=Actinokineospora globicatena TaxID=103729 RepID=A0A9W6QL50_9PSEU|nr:hypothetical protein Aglo03_13850 [Actinokineospora globicatena]
MEGVDVRLPDPSRSHAVLVGTSEYKSDRLHDLPAVERNLEALRAVLTDPALGGFPEDHVAVVHNPVDDAAVVSEIWRRAELAEDTLLVYLAGHGLAGSRSGELFLALGDTNPDQLPFRTLRYDELRTVVTDRGRFPADNRVVILDCCFAGRAIPAMSGSAVTGLTDIEGVYVLTATAPNHTALALPDAEHTAFTGAVLDLLRTGVPGGPELLTLTTVYERVLQTMRSRGYPRPEQINKDTIGKLALARNAAYVPAATVPEVDIRVVGIGGGGVNALNRLHDEHSAGYRSIAINTDPTSLLMSDADVKVDVRGDLALGVGAGANPELGRLAVTASADDIAAVLRGADLVFITCGEGGGTGTGGAPVVAELARRAGALTVGVVTRPFSFEGRRRAAQAEVGIAELRAVCDTVIVIANDRLLALGDLGVSLMDAFRQADQVLMSAIRSIVHLLTVPGAIRVGFDTVRAALTGAGTAVIGLGRASGPDRIEAAVRDAIAEYQRLTDHGIHGAGVILLSISGDSRISYADVSAAAALVSDTAHPDADLVFGAAFDDSAGDQVEVAIVAARFSTP